MRLILPMGCPWLSFFGSILVLMPSSMVLFMKERLMKLILEVNRQTPCFFSNKFLEKIVQETIRSCGCRFLDSKNLNISLAVVPAGEIKKINKKFRGKSAVTDVLSFADYASRKLLLMEKSRKIFLGEIIICPEFIRGAAKIDNVPFKKELACALAHGTLHLLGFKHGKEMFSIQDQIKNLR